MYPGYYDEYFKESSLAVSCSYRLYLIGVVSPPHLGVALALSNYVDPEGRPTQCAHPARYSPDDKFSEQRVTLKMRFNLLPTQQPPIAY
ncbi:unnamed protein product [Dibothriocephalus latus]|uniref:Nucleolar protein 10 n=1 Tax=Dibothriocephalus latus TaxID=60516 RepID=A0A3P7MFT3_DIBLA|nr:unnamed protein product [Dibothriocephalus latus]